MNLESVDMEKEFKYYNEVAPMQNANILGEEFKYRYFKNPNPVVNVTIVMLAGGTGLGDGFFGFAKYFMDRYSLINFNYPIAFSDNEKTAEYNEPINQDKKLKKISDLDIMKIRKKKKRRSKLWESEQHIQQSTRAK